MTTRRASLLSLLALSTLAGCAAPTLREQAPAEFRQHLPAGETGYVSLPAGDSPGSLLLVPEHLAERYLLGDAERVGGSVVGAARRRAEGRYEVALAFKPTWPRGHQWPRMAFLGVALFPVPADAGPAREQAIEAAILGSSPRLELRPKPRELGEDYATAEFELAEDEVPWGPDGSARFVLSHGVLDKQGTFARGVKVITLER